MKTIVIIINCLFLLFSSSFVRSQNLSAGKEKIIGDILEKLSDDSPQSFDVDELREDLEYFLNHPLDINNSSLDDLKKLKLFNDLQIFNLLNYLSKYGKIVSIYELQLIDGFSPDFITGVLPFITIGPVDNPLKYEPGDVVKYGKNELFFYAGRVLEQEEGYKPASDSSLRIAPNSRYLGSPEKLDIKYRFNYKNRIMLGIVAEKDEGEQFFSGNNKNGFDFYSAYFYAQNIKSVKKIIAGDYHLSFGQGLIVCSDWTAGKSSYIMNTGRSGQGISKYSSTDENQFFRGIGTTFDIGDIEVTGFYSAKKIDGNLKRVNNYDNENNYIITSLQTTGLHTTPSEVEDKHSVKEFITGGNIALNKNFYRLGLTAIRYEYDHLINPEFALYNKYDFRGKQNSDISFDYTVVYRNIRLFGEEAISENKGKGFVNGLVVTPVSTMTLSILYRNYSPDFHAYYGKSFSVSGNENENGLFTALQIAPFKKWTISMYYDYYCFPWLKYGVSSPSSGNDYNFRLTFSPDHKIEMYLNLKSQSKETDEKDSMVPIPSLMKISSTRIRYNISSGISDELMLTNRLEYVLYKESKDNPNKGFMMFQDLKYSPMNKPYAISIRYEIFDADSYYSSVYEYEPGILYSLTPGFYSKGTRFYFLFSYKIKKWFNVMARYAITQYDDKGIIGSDLSQINGNTKSSIEAMLKFQF